MAKVSSLAEPPVKRMVDVPYWAISLVNELNMPTDAALKVVDAVSLLLVAPT